MGVAWRGTVRLCVVRFGLARLMGTVWCGKVGFG